MIAIMCETPFQLLNALNIVYTKYNEECILFITEDMFESEKKFKINSTNSIIKKIYKVERNLKKNNLLERILSKLSRVFLDYDEIKLRKKIPNFRDYKSIDKFICIKYSDCAFDIYKKVKKNKKIEINLIEEGIGEYVLENGAAIEWKEKKYINKHYLMAPELYKLPTNIKIEKSPYLNNSNEFKEILQDIYHYRKDISKFKKIIYFGQAFAEDYKMPEFTKIEGDIFNKLLENINYENIVVKLHPRSDIMLNENIECINTISPWECSVNDIEDIENRIIISTSSTTIITPKLFCNKEPYVICTIKIYEKYMKEILKEYNYYEKLVKFLNDVKSTYMNKSKFFMPNTLEELEKILQDIKKKGII